MNNKEIIFSNNLTRFKNYYLNSHNEYEPIPESEVHIEITNDDLSKYISENEKQITNIDKLNFNNSCNFLVEDDNGKLYKYYDKKFVDEDKVIVYAQIYSEVRVKNEVDKWVGEREKTEKNLEKLKTVAIVVYWVAVLCFIPFLEMCSFKKIGVWIIITLVSLLVFCKGIGKKVIGSIALSIILGVYCIFGLGVITDTEFTEKNVYPLITTADIKNYKNKIDAIINNKKISQYWIDELIQKKIDDGYINNFEEYWKENEERYLIFYSPYYPIHLT